MGLQFSMNTIDNSSFIAAERRLIKIFPLWEFKKIGFSDRSKAFIVNRQQSTVCLIPFYLIIDSM
jgi:hypothetical protein